MAASAHGVDATPAGRHTPTVGTWLENLRPTPPAALVARLSELLQPYADLPAHRVPDVCLEAGEQLLAALLTAGSTERGTALDLLAADALVTYAFQAAADTPGQIETLASRAMQRISALPRA
jgi:hypothetical protein